MCKNQESFIKFTRKYLKNKIINSTDGFKNHESERFQIYSLLIRTIEKGESNSALIIGPRGSGKTTLLNDVFNTISNEMDMKSNAIIIRLNGLIHTDDNQALKSSAAQMNIDEITSGKVFGTFAENLAFLLTCLRTGHRESSKSLIFILEEFELFCGHSNQTLLYNLLDMTHNSQIPICVIGLTCRLDVTELFEKRVKSRFSHRQIFIFPGSSEDESPFQVRLKRVEGLLSFTEEFTKAEIGKHSTATKQWNKNIESLVKNEKFQTTMRKLHEITVCERDLKNILIVAVSKLNENKDRLNVEDFYEAFKNFIKDNKVSSLENLSVLEICLIIAMKHHVEIYDNEPFNFEMILTRYNKFANANALTQTVQRPVVLKAFEHIKSMELFAPVGNTGSHLQKEYQLYKLLFLPRQINEALKLYPGLPTEVHQWASSSLA